MRKKRRRSRIVRVAAVLLLCAGSLALWRGGAGDALLERLTDTGAQYANIGAAEDVPAYAGEPWVELNDNVPDFTDTEKQSVVAFETYAPLDALGRCGTAYANVCLELMPTEPRGEIGSVRPTGWQLQKYDFVDGKYLYNRCHLIGYQLTGENANERNLITGTRYLNIQGMLDFEDLTADYAEDTGNHVLYRVRPVFDGDDLLCRGVEMEGWSVEDSGRGVCFHVFAYNVQPGVEIDYATGASSPAE